jgi:large subunit ribosomal protein L27
VVTGSIIFRQRGTKWFPGENCGMGRDHTIFAKEAGFVKYYRDPVKHPKRQYIGVVFKREDSLPTPANAVTRRRLNMVTTPRREEAPAEPAAGRSEALSVTTRDGTVLTMRPDYSFREGNWEIGRAAERTGVKVRPFVKGDRWLAWRKANARKKRTAEEKAFSKKGKKVKKQKRTGAVKA